MGKKLKIDPKKTEYDGHSFRLIIEDETELIMKLKKKQEGILKDWSNRSAKEVSNMKTPEWTKDLKVDYGYGYASGWAGIGRNYYCPKTLKVLWREDDQCSCTEDEILHNDFMRMNILESMNELTVCLLRESLIEISDYLDEILLYDEDFPDDWDKARGLVIKAREILDA